MDYRYIASARVAPDIFREYGSFALSVAVLAAAGEGDGKAYNVALQRLAGGKWVTEKPITGPVECEGTTIFCEDL